MDLVDERTAIKATMRGLQANVQDLTDVPDVPAIMVVPDAPFDIHYTFEDDATWHQFIVWILVPFTDQAGAQSQLDDFLSLTSTNSVITAIQTDARFEVVSLRSYGVTSLRDEATRYLSAELVVVSRAAE